MNISDISNIRISLIVLAFLLAVSAKINHEDDHGVSKELITHVQDAYCKLYCFKTHCACFPPPIESLRFKQKYENPVLVEWLCKDDNVIIFKWTPQHNEKLVYVVEFRHKYTKWEYYDTTTQNTIELDQLQSDEEYQIRVWAISVHILVYGPFESELVKTYRKTYIPLPVTKFELLGWERERDQDTFNAIVGWEPAEDRVCYYEITTRTEDNSYKDSFETEQFPDKVLELTGGKLYSISIASKLYTSSNMGKSKTISVLAPNCWKSSVESFECVPNPFTSVNVSEQKSNSLNDHTKNLTYNVNISWIYTIGFIPKFLKVELVNENSRTSQIQNLAGASTNTSFENVELTRAYSIKLTALSAGPSSEITINRIIRIKEKMDDYNLVYYVLAGFMIFVCLCIILLLLIISSRNFFTILEYNRSQDERNLVNFEL